MLGGLLALSGCSDQETIQLDFSYADRPDARTLILAFDTLPSSGTSFRSLLAINLDDGSSRAVLPSIDPLTEDEGAEATALFLTDPVGTLGLDPGPLMERFGTDVSTSIRDLAAASFTKAETLRFEPGDAEPTRTAISRVTDLPSRFAETRIDPTCAKFRAMNGQVNVCRDLAFSTRLGATQFLFASRCQRFFVATVEGERVSVEAIDSPLGGREADATDAVCTLEGRKPSTPGFVPKSPAIHSARSDGAGSIAYGGLGVIYVDESGRARVTIPLPEAAGEIGEDRGVFWLVGDPKYSTPEFELFAMTARGRILRITREADTPRIEPIHDFGFAAAEDEGFGGLASPGPGRLVAVAPRSSDIVIHEQAETRVLPGPSGMGFATVSYVPSVGVLIAGESGRIFLVREGGLEAYEPPKGWSSRIESLGAFRDGFLFGGTNGYIGEHRAGRGFCDTQQLASATPRALYALGEPGREDSVFVISGKEQSRDRNAYGLLLPPLTVE